MDTIYDRSADDRCCYVVGDLEACSSLVKDAIVHALDIAEEEGGSGPFRYLINKRDLNTFPRDIFDPFAQAVVDVLPYPEAGSKVGSLLRLLGNINLTEAALIFAETPERPRSPERSGQEPVLRSRLDGEDDDMPHPGTRGDMLCQSAAACLAAASRVFSARAIIHQQSLVLAGVQYEWASALLLLRHKVWRGEGGSGPEEDRCVRLASMSFRTRCRHLPGRHIEIIQSCLQLGILLERRAPTAALRLWQQTLRDVAKRTSLYAKADAKVQKDFSNAGTQAPSPTVLWDARRSTTQSYRPSNLLSMFLWALPNAHFLGVYDPQRLRVPESLRHVPFERTILNMTDVGLAPFVKRLKAKVLSIYVNYCWTAPQLASLFRIVDDMRQVEKLLLRREQPHLPKDAWASMGLEEEEEEEHQLQADLFHGGSLDQADGRDAASSRTARLVAFVRSYPRLVAEADLLGSEKSTALGAPRPKPGAPPTWSGPPVGDDPHGFFSSLLAACETDVRSFCLAAEDRLLPPVVDPGPQASVVSSPGGRRGSKTQHNIGESESRDVRVAALEAFLSFESPLETYKLRSSALDMLCSILYLYLDSDSFTASLYEVEEVRRGRQMHVMSGAVTIAAASSPQRQAGLPGGLLQWSDPDAPHAVGELHYMKEYEDIVTLLEQMGFLEALT